MSPKEIHAELQRAFELLAALYGNLDAIAPETAFTIGRAARTIGEAKSLVLRDYYDQHRKEPAR